MRALLGRRRAGSGPGRPPRWGRGAAGAGGGGGDAGGAPGDAPGGGGGGGGGEVEGGEEARAPGPGGVLDRALEARLQAAQVRFLVREQFLEIPRLRYTAFQDVPIVACTFNANGRAPPKGLDLQPLLRPRRPGGLVVLGLQEVVPLNVRNVVADGMVRRGPAGERVADAWEAAVGAALNPPAARGGGYVRLLGHQMVGIYLTVWADATLAPHVSEARVTSVGCGVLGVFGNKGCVGAWLRVHDTALCILCAHLSSGQQPSDLARRNADAEDIVLRTSFPDPNDGGAGGTVGLGDADHVLLVGDLNYRLNLEDLEARRAMATGDWKRLRQADQLAGEMAAGRAFPGWEEGELTFRPTYKFRRGTDEYSGDMDGLRRRGSSEALSLTPGEGPGAASGHERDSVGEAEGDRLSEQAESDADRGEASDIDSVQGSLEGVGKREKVRTPAWCDRVLWQASGWIHLEDYTSLTEVRMSDHKPVAARFTLRARRYEDAFVHAAIAEAYRRSDLIEMHQMPRLDVPEKSVDFGEMRYCQPSARAVALRNDGEVPVYWSLECAEGDFPPWLRVSPVSGKVAVGETASLKLEALVRGGRRGSTEYLSMNTMDTILILTVEGGGATFIAIDARYKGSPFGLNMSTLVALRPPMRAGAQDLLCKPPGSLRGRSAAAMAGACEEEDVGARPEPAPPESAPKAGDGVKEEGEAGASSSAEESEERPGSPGVEGDEVGEVADMAGEGVSFCGKHDVPLELQRMVSFLTERGFPAAFFEETFTPDLLSQGLAKQSILQLVPEGGRGAGASSRSSEGANAGFKAQVSRIFRQLETDEGFTESTEPEAMLASLLLFFAEMPKPLLPDALADICRLCLPSKIGAEQLVAENLTSACRASFYYTVEYLRRVAVAFPGLKSALCSVFSQLWIEAPVPASGALSAYLGSAQSPHEQCAGFIDLFLATELHPQRNRLSVDDPDVVVPRVLP